MFNAGSIFAKLGIDTSQFQANVKGAQTTVQSFATQTSSALGNVASSAGSFGGSVSGMTGGMREAASSSTSLGSTLKGLAGSFVALYAIREVTSALKEFTSFAFNGAVKLEQVSIAFTTMLGSADLAKQSLENLAKFAKSTPFELPQVQEGATKLLAYGVTAADLIPTLQMVGDVAAGVGKDKFEPLIRAFGQVSAKGRLMGTELLQISETGFNVAEAMGVTRASLEDMVSKGEVSFGDLKQAFINATSDGGKFFGLMENQSKSAGGVISNLKDTFGHLATAIAGVDKDGTIRPGGLFDKAKTILQNLLDALNPNIDAMIELGDAVIDVVEAALTPFLGKIGDINAADLKGTLETWTARMEQFSIGVGIAANLINTLYNVLKMGFNVIYQAGVMFNAFVKVVAAVFQDASNYARVFVTQGLARVANSLNALSHGDFSGAMSSFNGFMTSVLNSSNLTTAAVGNLSATWSGAQDSLIAGAGDVVGAWDGLTTAISLAFQEASPEIINLKDDVTDLGGSATDAGDAIKDALGKVKDDSGDTKTAIKGIGDALSALKTKANDVFSTFKERKKDVLEAMDSMKQGVINLRKEIDQIKTDSRKVIDDLKTQFQTDKLELKVTLGENIGKELLALEKTISENSAEIVDIQNDSSDEIAKINADLYETETEAQEQFAKDSIKIEEDRAEEIARIAKQRDYMSEDVDLISASDVRDSVKSAEEEIQKIKHSISDYSTQAERDEAAERIAILEKERDDKIAAFNKQLDDELESVTTAAEKQQSVIQTALDEEIADAREKAAEAVAIQEQESADKIAILQQEIDEANAIMAANQATFTEYADAILEARRVASLDSIQVLMEQFQAEKDALKEKLETDIVTEKDARDQKIVDAKQAFADEMDINVENLKDLDKFWKKKENKYQDHLDTIASKRKKALEKLDEEFTAAFEAFDANTGGALTKEAGGTDIEISKDKSGNAQITIENMNVSNESDINTLITRLTNLLNAATA